MPTLHFKGKSVVQSHHLTIPYHPLALEQAASHSAAPGLHDNLIIHGDNLLALKALLPYFSGKIKCIYIDPPYNTGHEGWVYNDNVNSPMHQEWLRQVVDCDDLTRHDKWLCMIWPRLKLLRELLREDGLIFVSIDDNELHHLRMAMDELFGADNFIATIIWEKAYSPRMNSAGFSVTHDYILAYGKSAAAQSNRLAFTQNRRQFTNLDPRNGRLYRRRSLRKEGKDSRREDMPSLFFALRAPDGSEVYPIKPDGSAGRWRWTAQKYAGELAAGNVEWLCREGVWEVYARQYLDLAASQPPVTIWRHKEAGHNHEAQYEITGLLGRDIFETPKPSRLIKRILQIATGPDSLILDSFAGSGTTAHAVLALNAEDGGNRRFILIEQEAYAETLTAERVRRVIGGVPAAKGTGLRAGYGGSFSFFRLGPALDEPALLRGEALPSYCELARYVFFTATGEKLDESRIDEARGYLGASQQYEVYLIYQPDVAYLRRAALTLDWAQELGPANGKMRLVIAPCKFVDDETLCELRIEYCQLPFGVYRFQI